MAIWDGRRWHHFSLWRVSGIVSPVIHKSVSTVQYGRGSLALPKFHEALCKIWLISLWKWSLTQVTMEDRQTIPWTGHRSVQGHRPSKLHFLTACELNAAACMEGEWTTTLSVTWVGIFIMNERALSLCYWRSRFHHCWQPGMSGRKLALDAEALRCGGNGETFCGPQIWWGLLWMINYY